MASKQPNEFRRTRQKECPVCGSPHRKLIFPRFDDRYGQPDVYHLVRCVHCTACYLADPIAKEELGKLYEKYYPSLRSFPTEGSLLRTILKKTPILNLLKKIDATETLLSKVPKNSKVLDVGCGFYPDLPEEVRSRSLDWEGLEIDPKLVTHIQSNGLVCHQGELQTFSTHQLYDVILLSQVIEHQSELTKAVTAAYKLLKPGGKLLILTPNTDSIVLLPEKKMWIHWHVPYHTVIFNKRSIEVLASRHGFALKKYATYTPTHWHLLQTNYKPAIQGIENKTFTISFSPLPYLLTSLKLRLCDRKRNHLNPCLLAELEK